MKVLITGGAGFLGSHLLERLLQESHEVTVLDNMATSSPLNLLEACGNHADDVRLLSHDIATPFPDAIRRDRFDKIYNLACPASPIAYQSDPIQTWKTSVLGAINILELAEEMDARVLQASTSEVYGDPKVHPQTEEYWGNVNPIGIRSCYDEGKRAAESLFFDYWRERALPIRVARIFNTYGPRMMPFDGRVVTNFIMQGLAGDDITIYGDGRQTRSFCYVDDMIDGLVRLMEGDQIGPVNLGNPHEFTILELAQKVRELTDHRSNLVFKPLPKDDPMQRKPSIKRAKEFLNWEPKIQLDEGLERTLEYFKDRV